MLKICTFVMNNVFKCPALLLDNGVGKAEVAETKSQNIIEFFSETIMWLISTIFSTLGDTIIKMVNAIAYFIGRILLNIVDFLNVFVLQFSGTAQTLNFENNANLEDFDIIFKYIFSDVAKKIYLYIFFISLILLIIFTIYGIVKNEWQQAIGNGRSFWAIVKKAFVSLFMMLIVPILLVFGIIFSNVILTTVLNTISHSDDLSLGAEIFSASTYNANQFRVYAENNNKIPILYDFNGGFANVENPIVTIPSEGSTTEIDEQMEELEDSGTLIAGYSTWRMFSDDSFYELSEIDDSSLYYNVYDGPFLKTSQEEYFVMADFVDYAMRCGKKFYYINAQDVYDMALLYAYNPDYSGLDIVDDEGNGTVSQILNLITPIKSNGDVVKIDSIENYKKYKDGVAEFLPDYFSFNVNYKSSTKTYYSMEGTNNEADGTKYLLCYKQEMGENESNYLYVPVRQNDKYSGFVSNYLAQTESKDVVGSPFVARGIFSLDGYPTAIRESGSTIEFYRHGINTTSITDFNSIFNYGTEEDSNRFGFIGSIFQFVTGVDLDKLVPDVSFNFDMVPIFGKSLDTVTKLKYAEFQLNYNFNQNYLNIEHIYIMNNINIFILLFAAFTLFTTLFKVIIYLIQRIFELFLLWLLMPAYAAFFPMEDSDKIGSKTRFAKWKEAFLDRLLGVYGVYISFYLVLLICPIVLNITFIPESSAETLHKYVNLSVFFANYIIRILFILVLFTFIANGSKLAEDLFSISNKPQDPLKTGGDILKSAKKAVKTAANVFSGKIVVDTAKSAKKFLVDSIPGKSLIDKTSDILKSRKMKKTAEKEKQKNDAEAAKQAKEIAKKYDEEHS